MTTTLLNGQPDERQKAMMADYRRQRDVIQQQIKQDRINGEAALRRLLPIAQGHSGQCECVARLLLGCYNGLRFPMDLADLRSLDYAIMDDCLAVLRMDANCYQEVHRYFENGGAVFEKLAADWRFEDKGDLK